MSSAFECDRCHKLYTEAPCYKYKVKDSSKGGKFMDLCSGCQRIIDTVMDEPVTLYERKEKKNDNP